MKNEKAKKRRKKKGLVLVVAIVGVLLVCLLSAAGLGTGAYFYFHGRKSEGKQTANLAEQFQGRWQGTSPGRDRLRLSLDVSPTKFTFTAINVVVNEGDILNYDWNTVKTDGNTLLIRQERSGSGKTYDWSVSFKSADEISVTSTTDGKIIGNFTRLK